MARATAELAAAIVQDASNATAANGRLGGKHHPQRTCEAVARQVNSLVRFGTAPEVLSSAADGNRTCYASDDYSSGTLHTVHTLLYLLGCMRSLQCGKASRASKLVLPGGSATFCRHHLPTLCVSMLGLSRCRGFFGAWLEWASGVLHNKVTRNP